MMATRRSDCTGPHQSGRIPPHSSIRTRPFRGVSQRLQLDPLAGDLRGKPAYFPRGDVHPQRRPPIAEDPPDRARRPLAVRV